MHPGGSRFRTDTQQPNFLLIMIFCGLSTVITNKPSVRCRTKNEANAGPEPFTVCCYIGTYRLSVRNFVIKISILFFFVSVQVPGVQIVRRSRAGNESATSRVGKGCRKVPTRRAARQGAELGALSVRHARQPHDAYTAGAGTFFNRIAVR